MEKLFTGKTIEEAIEAACADLGKAKEDFAYEIVEYSNKGFLGIGSKPAEIRVNVAEQTQPKPARPQYDRRPTDRFEKNNRPSYPAREQSRPYTPPVKKERPKKEKRILEGDAAEVEKFIIELFDHMKASADFIDVDIEEGKYIKIEADGDDLAFLTRKQGEAIEAIQLITSLYMNRKNEKYYKAALDINNFREDSIEKLEHLAMKTANQVLKTRKRVTLRPMSSFQRRVIHSKLQEVDRITTYSVGEEPGRRVVVQYQWPEKKQITKGNL